MINDDMLIQTMLEVSLVKINKLEKQLEACQIRLTLVELAWYKAVNLYPELEGLLEDDNTEKMFAAQRISDDEIRRADEGLI